MAEDLKQIRVLQETTTQMAKDLSQVQTDVHQLQQTVSQLQGENSKSKQELVQLKSNIQRLSATVSTLEKDKLENDQNQQALAKELLSLRTKIKHQEPSVRLSYMEFEYLKIEAAMRKQNLIIEGIREPHHERIGSTGDQVFRFIREVLGLSKMELDMAYRLGRPRHGSASPRPIFVRFTRLGERMEVWKLRTKLNSYNNSQFTIREDLPLQLRPIQAALLRVLQEAKKYPDRYRNVSIRDFQLYLDVSRYGIEELESLPEEFFHLHPREPTSSVFFSGRSPISRIITFPPLRWRGKHIVPLNSIWPISEQGLWGGKTWKIGPAPQLTL